LLLLLLMMMMMMMKTDTQFLELTSTKKTAAKD
jgi:hypothetical protein